MNNNILTEELKIKGRKIKKIQMIFGIVCLIIFLILAFNINMFVDDKPIYTLYDAKDSILFTLVLFVFFGGFLLFFCLNYFFRTKENNYSYLRISDLLIVSLRAFQFLGGVIFIGLGLYLMDYFSIGSIGMCILLVVLGNLMYLFLLSDDFMRKIYYFIVNLFKLDNSSFDKNVSDDVKIVYIKSEKRYVYCSVDEKENISKYASNSFDEFRYGFSSQITALGMPINLRLIKLQREGKKTIKKYKCKKLKFEIVPKIDENNYFEYVIKYYCLEKSEKYYYNLEELNGTCKVCPYHKK